MLSDRNARDSNLTFGNLTFGLLRVLNASEKARILAKALHLPHATQNPVIFQEVSL